MLTSTESLLKRETPASPFCWGRNGITPCDSGCPVSDFTPSFLGEVCWLPESSLAATTYCQTSRPPAQYWQDLDIRSPVLRMWQLCTILNCGVSQQALVLARSLYCVSDLFSEVTGGGSQVATPFPLFVE